MNYTVKNEGFGNESSRSHDVIFDILQVALFSIILLYGCLGNSLVYYYFALKKRPRSKGSLIPEHFLSCLALVNLLSSVVNPLYHLHRILIGSWSFGGTLCKIIGPLGIILITTSSGILIVVAFDREQTILFNSLQYFTRASCNAALFLAVLYNIFIKGYLFKEFNVVKTAGGDQRCEIEDYQYRLTYTIPRILSFILGEGVLFMVFLVVNILVLSRKRFYTSDIWKMGALWQKRKRDSLKTIHMVNMMVASYFTVILPYNIMTVAFLASNLIGKTIKHNYTTNTVAAFLELLTVSSSCLNFPIYCYTHSGIRKYVRHLICFRKLDNVSFLRS